MGLAQRFKNKLDKQNIFVKTPLEQDFEKQDIKFISKPVTDTITVQPKELRSSAALPVVNLSDLETEQENITETEDYVSKFSELETQIINKIRQTPYWNEYSKDRQKHMISAYFDKKSDTECTLTEREEFIQNILALACPSEI